MSVGASIDVSGNLQGALNALKPEAALQAVRRGMKRGAQLISSQIIENRLTGKGPFPVPAHKLGVRSGRLRQSVRVGGPTVSGLEVTVSIGSRVRYAAAHEFGFSGKVPVAAHMRRGGATGKGKKKVYTTSYPVKAHQRQVLIAERAPFRTGIEENLDLITGSVVLEVTESMKSS